MYKETLYSFRSFLAVSSTHCVVVCKQQQSNFEHDDELGSRFCTSSWLQLTLGREVIL